MAIDARIFLEKSGYKFQMAAEAQKPTGVMVSNDYYRKDCQIRKASKIHHSIS
jgi:hypothetical protein